MIRRTALSPWVGVIAAAQFAVLVATSMRYGYHRDELYFIVAGSHPALGYPDQPPLVPLLCRAMHSLWSSLVLLRLPSALVATTTTFDLLSTTALLWLVVRALVRRSARPMLAAGTVVGLGVEAKPQVGFVAVVVVVVLLVRGPRDVLRSWWTAGGAVAAVAITVPYAVWQQRHGWPQLTVARNIGGSAEGGRVGFIPFQLLLVSPVLAPVWLAGLLAPFRRLELQRLRFVPVTYVVLLVAYIAGNGKAYYLASLYPAALALGALPAADWIARTRLRARALVAAIALSAVISGFIALPLLPARSLQGSVVMAVNPDQGETVGWPRFVDTVTRAWRAIPSGEREHTAIFTGNYGEAGAVDVLGRSHGLPRAYSGHNGFSEWGMPPARDTYALLIDYESPALFGHCRRVATIDNGIGLENDEQGTPLLLCRPTASWSALWPLLRHYG